MYPSFNYIGSKIKLLEFLKQCMEEYIEKPLKEIDSFSDLFSGTGIVSYFMITNGIKKVISNDLQYYGYIISSILTKNGLDIDKLRKLVDQLNNISIENPGEEDFIYTNYTPHKNCKRMFLTNNNGLKVDRIRQKIESLRKLNDYEKEPFSFLNEKEYICLLKLLLYAVTKVSNTSSTFGAYLKKFKPSAQKDLFLDFELINKLCDYKLNCEHISYNKNIMELNFIKTDICYLDPPYNSRKYSRNFDLLETIAKYDNPNIEGITGLRKEATISTFCSKVTAKDDFKNLFNKIESKYLFMSYSSEGLLSKNQIIELLNDKWSNIVCYEREYKRFKSNKNGQQNKTVIEYLFCGIKK